MLGPVAGQETGFGALTFRLPSGLALESKTGKPFPDTDFLFAAFPGYHLDECCDLPTTYGVALLGRDNS